MERSGSSETGLEANRSFHAPVYYREQRNEVEVFRHAYRAQLPLLLKGPTGCGKSRFVEAMAAQIGRPLITVACHDDTSATDLLGRYLIEGGNTVWVDGPVTRAVREGAILYLDEVAEAREDVIVVLHPLTDHRRELFLDRRNEVLKAPAEFMLLASFNPGYQRGLKELKASTRQRFVSLGFQYPSEMHEVEIISNESGVDNSVARKLVSLGKKVRALKESGLSESVSTRLLVDAGKLINLGLSPRIACEAAIVHPLTDDALISEVVQDLVNLMF